MCLEFVYVLAGPQTASLVLTSLTGLKPSVVNFHRQLKASYLIR